MSERVTPPFDLRDLARVNSLRGVGRLESVPWIMISFAELRRLPLDHRAGFLLSLIDGHSDIASLLDMCGMPAQEALDILTELVAMGVVEMKTRG